MKKTKTIEGDFFVYLLRLMKSYKLQEEVELAILKLEKKLFSIPNL